MNIMDMDDIRIEFLNFAQEIPGGDYGEASVISGCPAELLMDIM